MYHSAASCALCLFDLRLNNVSKGTLVSGIVQGRFLRRYANEKISMLMNDAAPKSGVRGFTRGFLPTILRAFPANAAAFTAFDTTMRNFNNEATSK